MTQHPPSAPGPAHTPSPGIDQIGIAASLACAVHCLLAPLLMLLLPAAGSAWSHPGVHWALAALVLPLALMVICRGYRVHRRRSALTAAGLGAALIIAGLILPATAEAQAASPGETRVAEAPAPCTDACCPTITYDPAVGASLHVPPGSAVTMLGSVLLMAAHGINLQGCRCFRRSSEAAGCACAG